MLHAQFDRLSFPFGEDFDVLTLDFEVVASEMHQSCQDGEAAGIDDVPIVVEDVDVGAHVEAFGAGDDAEGFGVEGAGAADGLLKEAREEDFGGVLSGGSVRPSFCRSRIVDRHTFQPQMQDSQSDSARY